MKMNYNEMYGVYKKLPIISAIATFVAVFIWAIIDCFGSTTAIGELGFLGFVLWLMIDALIAPICGLLTAIMISATVVRTEATTEMRDIFRQASNDLAAAYDEEQYDRAQEETLEVVEESDECAENNGADISQEATTDQPQ